MLYRRFTFGDQDEHRPKARNGWFAKVFLLLIIATVAAIVLGFNPDWMRR